MMYPEPQEVFEIAYQTPPEVLRAHLVMERIHRKHEEYVLEHGKYPPEYLDDCEAEAKKYGFEFTHPKYAAGPQLVESKPTVH